VRRELRQHGFRVLPEEPLPFSPQYRQQVREQLQQSELSVHIIGSEYGAVPEREAASVVAIQYEQAGERIAAGTIRRVVWVPPGASPSEERQRAFLHALRTDPTAHRGTEILEATGVEDLKTMIRDILKRSAAAKALPTEAPVAGQDPIVYLICDPSDLDAALPLRDYLMAQGVEAVLPLKDGDERQIREDHQQNLIDCEAALLYWGRAGEAWVRSQLRELLKAPGYGRPNAIQLQGVYLATPASEAKGRFMTRQAMMLRETATFSTDVQPFLERLAGAVT
jgi:hypothetical protein